MVQGAVEDEITHILMRISYLNGSADMQLKYIKNDDTDAGGCRRSANKIIPKISDKCVAEPVAIPPWCRPIICPKCRTPGRGKLETKNKIAQTCRPIAIQSRFIHCYKRPLVDVCPNWIVGLLHISMYVCSGGSMLGEAGKRLLK